MNLSRYIDFRNQIAAHVGVIDAEYAATGRVDGIAVEQLRERCFDARRRVSAKAIDVRLAICEIAGVAGKCSTDRDISELSVAMLKLDRAIGGRRRA